ncbi:Y-family DNA polymerase [Microbulbifer sp. PSTR4-B]|uniref:Y-family DNA polymerase n=1 Tax=Microbulbifer sp. PSTR4-B TaxID=3243396 RepID=UPI004039BCE2
MLWLCIQFPKLPLEALTRAQTPEEKNQPLAIVEKQIIVEANKAAFGCGVISGLSSATALNLCPDLQILSRDRGREQWQLEELALWGGSFTPMVFAKAINPEQGNKYPQLYIELNSCLGTYGGLRPLFNQIQLEIRQMGISHSLGLGPNPSAALLLSQIPTHSQWLQQTQTLPTSTQWKQWINDTPCKLLECDSQTIQKLYFLGFKQIGQLLAAPVSEIEMYFGRAFIGYLTFLSGSPKEPAACYHPPDTLNFKVLPLQTLNNSEQLLFFCNLLLRELYQLLQHRKLSTRLLHWQIKDKKRSISIYTYAPSSALETQELSAHIKLQFEKKLFFQTMQNLHLYLYQLPSKSLTDQGGKPPIAKHSNRENESQRLMKKLTSRLGHHALSHITSK